MHRRQLLLAGAASAAVFHPVLRAQAPSGVAPKPLASMSIYIPGGEGGGWDQTGRALGAAIQAAGLASKVSYENKGGKGGTIGLADFVARYNTDPGALLVGGMVMLGAIAVGRPEVTLTQVSPVARLTNDYMVLVAKTGSQPATMAALAEAMRKDLGKVAFTGGSAGGVDHITVGLLAKAAGVDPTKINYVAFSGGGEALAAILGNQVTVGISGVGEFLPQVEAGAMRMLAVSTADKWPGTDAPTLMESGFDVNVQNWRMVAAAPGLTDEQKAAVAADIDKLANSAGWKAMLETKGWANTYLAGADFDAQLAKEIEATTAVLKDIGLVK